MDRFQRFAELLLDSPWTFEAIEQVVARFAGPRSSARKKLAPAILVKFPRRPTRSALVAFLKKNELVLCRKVAWDRIETAQRFDMKVTSIRGAIAAPFAGSIPVFLPSALLRSGVDSQSD